MIHLLHGKEVGTFIVRQSSKAATMALSVRLPAGANKPHIEHYLIESSGGLSTSQAKFHLEGSENYFTAVPTLVAHYAEIGQHPNVSGTEELPTQLRLPRVLSDAGRQQLTSLSLLGQDFWQLSAAASNSLNSTTKEPSGEPPVVPPKLIEVSKRPKSPLVDPKKSRAVAVVTGQVKEKKAPNVPPRTILNANPIAPPRTSKPKNLVHNSTHVSTTSSSSQNGQHQLLVTTTVSVLSLNGSNNLVDEVVADGNGNAIAKSISDGEQLIISDGQQQGDHCNHESSSHVTTLTQSHFLPHSESDLLTLSPVAEQSSLISDQNPPPVPSHGPPKVKGYFCSLAEDKFSDYEDIFSFPTHVSNQKKAKEQENGPLPTYFSEEYYIEELKREVARETPSPFYNEPVDAIKKKKVACNRSQSLESLLKGNWKFESSINVLIVLV